jgi:hypothetical protein
MPCGKRGLRYWRSSIAILKGPARTPFIAPRPTSALLFDPTSTAMCFPSSTPNMPMVRVIAVARHLQDVDLVLELPGHPPST